ncbi:hypothetical protein ES703_93699 [subsurface metagenome]
MIRRILIVEPDPKTAQDIFLLFHSEYGRFGRERYEPEIAESVARAAEQVQTINFHCVIMDVELPEMKGYEAVPLIKMISKNIPIIMTADKNTLELETRVREQDVYYYHLRCFDRNELRLAVRSVFEESGTVKMGRKPDKGAAKSILLKQLALFQKEKED